MFQYLMHRQSPLSIRSSSTNQIRLSRNYALSLNLCVLVCNHTHTHLNDYSPSATSISISISLEKRRFPVVYRTSGSALTLCRDKTLLHMDQNICIVSLTF